ncbi:MAG TPA: recombinase family protein, partial [Clostridiales bacterium]|nr:recombinase family protein [Clostridiales bacterium]
LEGVNAGRYAAVLCMDIDRLGRGGMADQGIILDAFRYSETLIVTPDKTYNLSDEMDEELTEFKAFMARREYKMIRKRMRRGLMQTIESGGYIANPPYGYRKIVVDKLPTLEIVEEEAVFIRMMY